MSPETPAELIANARQCLTTPDLADADRLVYPAATIARVVSLLDEAVDRLRAETGGPIDVETETLEAVARFNRARGFQSDFAERTSLGPTVDPIPAIGL